MKKVAVILAGSGHLDGSEIREAVLTLLSLDRLQEKHGFEILIMAPNRNQHHVMDHYRREETQESRNMLVEAARIARGDIRDMAEVSPEELDALIMPGGFGAAKNLSDFAFKGGEGQVDEQLHSFLTHCHEKKKPIGGICISPALISLVLGPKGVTVTLGLSNDTIHEVESTGAKHHDCSDSTQIHVDKKNLLVTTPAYMHDTAKTHQVAEGIDKCCQKVIELMMSS